MVRKMRGLVHYLSGLAASTFFIELMRDVQMGCLFPLLPAAAAYLPDFFDFKFWKFLEKWDYNIDPAPLDPEENKVPIKRKINELSAEKRYQLCMISGRAYKVKNGGDKLEFELDDGTGKIKVKALGDDVNILLSAIGREIREDEEVSITGYLDFEGEEKVFIVSDAPHPMFIAQRVADAIDAAYERGEVRVKLQTIRYTGDIYRRYIVDLDSDAQTVRVAIGPYVTVGSNVIDEKMPPEHRRMAEVKTRYPFEKKYPKPTVIEAFSGPSIGFKKVGDKVEEVFLPWHREWSHSFVTGVFVAALIYVIFKLIGYPHSLQLAFASMIGFWLHIIEDQLGFMGGNLFYPFSSKRIPGLGIGESGSAVLNFSTAWLMISFMIANFNAFSSRPPIPLAYHELIMLLSIPSILLYAYALWMWSASKKRIIREEKEVEEALKEEEELGGT